MKHLATLCAEFFKRAIDRDWWSKLSPDEQKQYILQHRRTKLRPTLTSPKQIMQQPDPVGELNRRTMKRVLNSIPKEWKKTLIYNGVGQDSSFEQLPDALRPRAMKQAFDDNTQAIVAFKAGTPITQMQPEFIITRTYEPEKFNCKRMKDNQGNPINQDSYDAYVSESKPKYRRGYRYDQKKTDLRMTNIVEKLPDQAYTVFAIKADPERMKLRQMRGQKADAGEYRSVEKALIAKTVKPVYDYYSENLQKNLDQLKSVAVPSFENVMNADPYTKDPNSAKVEQIMQNVKAFRDKLSSLNYRITSAKREHLPAANEPYLGKNPAEDAEYKKRKIHRFLDEVKSLKDSIKDDYDKAIRYKKRQAVEATQNQDFQESADILEDIGLKELAETMKKLSAMEDKSKVNINDLVYAIQTANTEKENDE